MAFLLFSVVYVGAQPVFKFQSNFWINLHLYLKAEGWWQNHNRPLKIMTYKPDISEQETWKRCVNGYSELSKKKLVFDEQLINISNSLTLQNSDILPTGIGIDESLVKLLNDAAPIYRKYVWKNQSKINELD